MDWMAIGVSLMLYDETQNDVSFSAQAGMGRFYAAARYESPKIKMLGQPLGDSDLYSLGFGVRIPLVDGLELTAEVGYAYIDDSIHQEIQDEIVYTKLVRDHFVPNRPIPLVDLDDYRTSYEVDHGPYIRLGISYRLYDHAELQFGYRIMQLDQEYTLRDTDPAALQLKYGAYGEGYWRQDTQLDLSAFEVGVMWKF